MNSLEADLSGNTNEKIFELQKIASENRMQVMSDQIENRLYLKLRRALQDDMVTNNEHIATHINQISQRFENLEAKMLQIERVTLIFLKVIFLENRSQ